MFYCDVYNLISDMIYDNQALTFKVYNNASLLWDSLISDMIHDGHT